MATKKSFTSKRTKKRITVAVTEHYCLIYKTFKGQQQACTKTELIEALKFIQEDEDL